MRRPGSDGSTMLSVEFHAPPGAASVHPPARVPSGNVKCPWRISAGSPSIESISRSCFSDWRTAVGGCNGMLPARAGTHINAAANAALAIRGRRNVDALKRFIVSRQVFAYKGAQAPVRPEKLACVRTEGPGSDSFWLSCYNSGDACAREAPADAWGDRLSKQRYWVFASVLCCDRFMVACLRYWWIRLGSDRPRRRRSHRGDAGRRRLFRAERLPHNAQLRDGRQRAAIHLASRPADLPGVLGLSLRHCVLLCASGVRSRTRHARRIPSRSGVAADLYRAQRVARHRAAEHPRAAGERAGTVHAQRFALDAGVRIRLLLGGGGAGHHWNYPAGAGPRRHRLARTVLQLSRFDVALRRARRYDRARRLLALRLLRLRLGRVSAARPDPHDVVAREPLRGGPRRYALHAGVSLHRNSLRVVPDALRCDAVADSQLRPANGSLVRSLHLRVPDSAAVGALSPQRPGLRGIRLDGAGNSAGARGWKLVRHRAAESIDEKLAVT